MFLSSHIRKFHNTYLIFSLSQYFHFYHQTQTLRSEHNVFKTSSNKVRFMKEEQDFQRHNLGYPRMGSKTAHRVKTKQLLAHKDSQTGV